MLRKPPKLTRDEALDAKPTRVADAQHNPIANGGAAVTVKLQSPRWAGWLFRYPAGATKTFELDAVGLFVWELCDGRHTVRQIIRALSERYKLNLREAEVSSLSFLQTLARKGLIGLEIKR